MTTCSTEGEAQYPFKDPDEILDFENDWSQRLIAGDTIVASDWIVPVGITEDDAAFDGTTTTIWLSGGTLGETYHLVNRITTMQGRTRDRSKYVTIRQN